ncbi:LOW QUALITY PROTEIN: ribosomal protein eL39-like 2 [Rhynchonycteris naso]
MSSQKTFKIKRFLEKKQNWPILHWIQMKNGKIKIRYNFKRRHWRRTKLGL